ncbi:MAG: glycosyltransferase family 2 protein [bacterium]
MKISLIIPAYNEEKYINRCISSAEKHSSDLFEIIVVDNNSTDKTKEIAESFSNVRVIHEKEKGVTRARQRGFLESGGDILAFIDSDTYLNDEWFEILKKEFTNSEKLVCLSGPYIYYDVPKYQRVLVWIYWNIFARIAYLLAGYMVVGGNFAIRRDVLEKMNGFDTTIDFYGEDTNTARRASKYGKVKFNFHFNIFTSGRRFFGQGLWNTAIIYVSNFFSEVFLKKPITKDYTDLR